MALTRSRRSATDVLSECPRGASRMALKDSGDNEAVRSRDTGPGTRIDPILTDTKCWARAASCRDSTRLTWAREPWGTDHLSANAS